MQNIIAVIVFNIAFIMTCVFINNSILVNVLIIINVRTCYHSCDNTLFRYLINIIKYCKVVKKIVCD